MIKNLLHGGSGGFDGDGASDGDDLGSDRKTDRDGLVRGLAVGDVIVTAEHTDVVACAVVVVVAGVGWTGIDSWRICFESAIGI